MMFILRRSPARAGASTGVAVLLLLGACESARVAAPEVRPSPAENAVVAAGKLGLPANGDMAAAQASLAARVEGWNTPATGGSGAGRARMDEESLARARRLEARLRASIAAGERAPADPR